MCDKICKTCRFWKERRYDLLEGECSEIRDKIDVDIHYGWDGGYVERILTECDFGCNLWKEKNNGC